MDIFVLRVVLVVVVVVVVLAVVVANSCEITPRLKYINIYNTIVLSSKPAILLASRDFPRES